MSEQNKKVPLWERMCFGFGDLGSCLFWITIMSQLLYFYTDVFGLSGKAAGWMFFISRVADAIFDVVIGMTADRTKTRWGKFRPYILFGAIPLCVSAVLAFTTPEFGATAKVVYAYATFIGFMFLYSTVNIPYTALLGVISGDPTERTSASSFKFVGAFLAGIIVSASVLPLADAFGKGNPQKGWQMAMIIYAIAALVCFFITFAVTRERIQPIAQEKTPIGNDLKDLSKNVPWMLLFAVTILFILFVCIRMSVATHYFKYFVGEQVAPWLAHAQNFVVGHITNPVTGIFGKAPSELLPDSHKFGFVQLTSIYNTLGQAVSLVGVLLVPWFTRLAGRKKALIILFVIALICTSAFWLLKPEDLGLIYFFQMLGSITGGPISALLWVLYADTADYSEWKTGRRATGLVFSASIMSNKLGWAFGSMLAAFILDQTGFIANVVQTSGVLVGLKGMMSIIPSAIGVLALVLLLLYKLDETTMAKIKGELDERRKTSGEPAVPVN
jgi:glycoside/pentoside/hexuronide:cation symporter, GPH family